jgi:hypothetical protein
MEFKSHRAEPCLNSTFYYCDKIPEKNQLKRRKDLFWLAVSEVSVHNCLATLLWACGGKHLVEEEDCSSQGIWEARERERKGLESQHSL